MTLSTTFLRVEPNQWAKNLHF